MPIFFNYNGKLFDENTAIAGPANRGLRYGDGCFETMKMVNEEIKLEAFHFERLFSALQILRFKIPEHFTADFLKEQIYAVCLKNKNLKAARIRLNIFRKNGGPYDLVDRTPEFVIEAQNLSEDYLRLNEKGLTVNIYGEARKACDHFSHLKSNNYLPYLMAALYAKENKLDDCMILNANERICDTSISNVFWIDKKVICTPPLSEGGISGVMRRHLLQSLPLHGYMVQEKNLELADLLIADEVFLTNAISGIRWVKQFREKQFTNGLSAEIYSLVC
jgi:aminodeoxychorismate lyase